jgi:demethylmenaquinone methyltransferase/2-methoxy-6-polyprenyl-1,4-benzoquinol methylase
MANSEITDLPKGTNVVPYKDDSKNKKEQVADMFNSIAHKYDFLNHLLSLGIDVYWRNKAIEELKKDKPQLILDIATGTGDFAITALKAQPRKIIGVDISEGMLAVGQHKIEKMKLTDKISLQLGDSERLQFPDNYFDAVIVAFGVRNFEDLGKGLTDMYRVLKPGGKAVILEFSKPEYFPLKQMYNFYFKNVLPTIGNSISKDNAAYTYLPESVNAFPCGTDFVSILHKIGFTETKCETLTFGISSIYSGKKV